MHCFVSLVTKARTAEIAKKLPHSSRRRLGSRHSSSSAHSAGKGFCCWVATEPGWRSSQAVHIKNLESGPVSQTRRFCENVACARSSRSHQAFIISAETRTKD